jgi:hypothetical protein
MAGKQNLRTPLLLNAVPVVDSDDEDLLAGSRTLDDRFSIEALELHGTPRGVRPPLPSQPMSRIVSPKTPGGMTSQHLHQAQQRRHLAAEGVSPTLTPRSAAVREMDGDGISLQRQDSWYRNILFDRKKHTGALHYVTQRTDRRTGQMEFVPSELSAKVGDVVVVRLFLDVETVRLSNKQLRARLSSALVSPSTVVEPELASNGALMITLGQIGTHTFSADKNPDLSFTAHVAPAVDKIRAGAKLMTVVITGVVLCGLAGLATALWANSQSFFSFMMNLEDVPYMQGVVDRLEKMFFDTAFVWFVVATFAIFIMIIVRLGLAFRNDRVHMYRSGYEANVHLRSRIATAFVASVVVALSMAIWYYSLVSNSGFTDFFITLTDGAGSLLNDAVTTAQNVNAIATELPKILPLVEVPASAAELVEQIGSIASTARDWTEHGQDIARGAFRIIALIRFVALTVIMYAAAVALNGAYFGNASVMRGAMWALWFAFAMACLSIGTSAFLLGVADEAMDLAESIVEKQTTEGEVEASTGISDKTILKVVVACSTGGLLSPTFINDVALSIIDSWNKNAPPGFKLPTNVSFANQSTIDAQIQYLNTEITNLQEKLEADPNVFTNGLSEFVNITAPFARAMLAVARNALTVSDCGFVREDVAVALPYLKNGAVESLRIQIGLIIALIVFLILGVIVCTWSAFVLRRPKKKWYCWTTKRWFRFRYSLIVHRRVNTVIGSESKALIRKLNGNFIIKPLPWCSWTGVLVATYLFHHTCAVLLFFMGALLVTLNYSSDDGTQSLPQLLRIPSYVLLVPAWLIPLEFQICSSVPPVPRPILRLLSAGCAIAALIMSFSYAETAGSQSAHCVTHVKSERKNGLTYPFTEGCTADRVFRLVEMSAYASVVAAVCFLSVLSASVVLINLQRHLWPTKKKKKVVDVELDLERSVAFHTDDLPSTAPALSRRKNMLRKRRAVIGVMVLLTCVVVPVGITLAIRSLGSGARIGGAADDTGQSGPFMLPDRGCNGHYALCKRRVNEIVWATSHNAMSATSNGFVAPNNFYPMADSLHAGFRAFTLDVFPPLPSGNDTGFTNIISPTIGTAVAPVHNSSNSTISNGTYVLAKSVLLCHGACFLGSVSMLDEIQVIGDHLASHPQDVVVLFLEQYVPMSWIMAVFDVANMTNAIWAPGLKPGDQNFTWPTLDELGAAGTRLIVFSDEPPGSPYNPVPAPPQVRFSFDYVAETNYAVSEFADFNCDIVRGGLNVTNNETSEAIMRDKAMFLNQFITAPLASPFISAKTNAQSAVWDRYSQCDATWGSEYGSRPNFIAVDFWSEGDTLLVVDQINQQQQ